jgi:hypothetical protein
MKFEDYRKHEVAFCADVSKWADRFFESRPELPFGNSDIESFGRGSRKRHDLRFYERAKRGRGKLALSAEVKLPGTAHGRSPFDPALVQDAFEKADRAVCRYFFTWNVEHLALFDRSLFDRPLYERCIGQWPLGSELNRPTDVERPEVKAELYERFPPIWRRSISRHAASIRRKTILGWYEKTSLRFLPEPPSAIFRRQRGIKMENGNAKKSSYLNSMRLLNSTLVGLFKTFYGRYAGTEGNLKTEIVDAFLLEIPDPRDATEAVLEKMETALASMQKREVRLTECAIK